MATTTYRYALYRLSPNLCFDNRYAATAERSLLATLAASDDLGRLRVLGAAWESWMADHAYIYDFQQAVWLAPASSAGNATLYTQGNAKR